MRKLALVMAMVVVLTSVNTGAFNAINKTYTVSAAQKNTLFGETIENNNVEYQLKDGVLTVSGTGVADNSYRTKYKADKIKKVVIKSGITGIADNTFSKLKNLKKITIPNTVKKLGISSMSGLNLDKITLPNSVEEIGRDCMRGGKCDSVTMPGKFTMRRNVNDAIGEEEEDTCREMFEILPKTNHVHLTTNFEPRLSGYYCTAKVVHTWKKDSKYKTYGNNIYSKNGKTLVFVPAGTKYLKVRKGCKKVLYLSFNYYFEPEDWKVYFCNKLKTIELPSSVKSIEVGNDSEGPFQKSKLIFHSKKLSGNVLTVLLENEKKGYLTKKYGVKDVNGMKISYDHVLMKVPEKKKSIVVPKGVKHISYLALRVDGVKPNVYLKKITLPSSMKTIDDNAFSSASKLESVKIPNSVTKIGDSAFSGCKLKSIKLPKKLKSIGFGAFSGTNLTSVTIPKSVKKLGNYCFDDTMRLKKVVFKGNIKAIPEGMFNYSSIKDIEIPNTVTKIGNMAFSECRKLEKIVIPENVNSIGEKAFESCRNLSNVKFNTKLCSIGEYAFYRTDLKEIVIPGGIKEVGDSAFSECPLKRVELQEGIETIDLRGFLGTYKDDRYGNTYFDLVDISIPKSLKKIKVNATNDNYYSGASCTFTYSTNRNLNNANVIEMKSSNRSFDVSLLRNHSELYCECTLETNYLMDKKHTSTMLYHFTFK